jgi:crotonobetainyl-CoA:carnitine CoA-transferase CaiB-like acyl-CoA transferase
MAMTHGALDGVRVVELGQLIAGPFCGQLMGDMGADVIKVEPPGQGDPMRSWGRGDKKLWWEVIARNKRSVSANLRKPEGQSLLRRLAAKADVLIENFKPGTLERWGLGPERLLADNPRLVIVRVSGYGQTGPYSPRAGFGGVAEAMGGLRYIVGHPDRPPARLGISLGDSLAATYACMGALAALHARERSGRGQVVDMALYESVLQVMESLIPEYAATGEVRQRSGSVLPGIAPSNVYSCRDGELVIGANKDEPFARLCSVMGMPELVSSPYFASHVARGQHQQALDEIISEWTATRTIDEVERAMHAASIPAGRIYRAPEMMVDEHFAARGALVEVDTPRWGPLKMQGCFPRLSDTPSAVRRPAPSCVGEHNAEVYGELLSLSAGDLRALTDRGVI